jgi:hypothetical protein
MKIYVVVVEAFKKNERQSESQLSQKLMAF